ncbi:MAG: extracellular solute-binding protein [Oscillibacter sp.]|nr:extracellular solute-binding protein [Oscillibacter sp.]
MKSMKKVLALLLALTVVLALAACGGSTASTSNASSTTTAAPAANNSSAGGTSSAGNTAAEPEALAGPDNVDLKELAANAGGEIYVEIWGKDSIGDSETSRGYQVAKMAEEFSDMYENVKVEYIYQGGYTDVQEKVMAAAAANDLPTMFMTEESMVKGFEAIAADINAWVPSATVNNYQAGLLTSMIVDGKLLGAPFARSLPVMVCNKEILAKAGWTGSDIKTIDDLLRCAKEVYKTTGIPGYAIWWDTDLWHWESIIYADGGQILSDDGSVPTFGKDYDYVGAKFANKVKEGLLEGYIISPYTSPKPYDEMSNLFCNGELAIMMCSCNSMPGRAQRAAENGYTLETYVQPAGEGGIHVTGGGSNWVLCESATYEEKMFAGAFLAYLAQDEQVMRITSSTGSMMITNSAMETDAAKQLLEENPYFQATYDTIPYLHERPNTPYWAEMYTYGADKLAQFTLNPGSTDIEAMIDDMEVKFAQIIEDNAW